MTIKFGTWSSEYALGEKLRVAEMKHAGNTDNDINMELEYYKGSGTRRTKQKHAEIFLELVGGSHGGSSALFGPIERSKENTERIHAITLAMGADTGKHDHTPNAYNAAIVPTYILKTREGEYITAAGAHTANKEKAQGFYSHEEIKQIYPSYQAVGWAIVEI